MTKLTQKPIDAREDGVSGLTEHDDRETDQTIEGLPPFKARIDADGKPKCGVVIPPMSK